MTFGPVFFPELPDVDNVAVQHQDGGVDGGEVAAEFLGPAAVGAKVHVRDDYDIKFSFFQGLAFTKTKPAIYL